MKIRILGPVIPFFISIVAMAVIAFILWQSNNHGIHPSYPNIGGMNPSNESQSTDLASVTSTSSLYPTPSPSHESHLLQNPTTIATKQPITTMIPSPTSHPTITITPSPTSHPTITITPSPTSHPTITITPTFTVVPTSIHSGYREICDPMIYEGIQSCMMGPYYVVRINPKNPYVRFETVLPLGYDREGNFGECLDVQLPDSIQAGESTGLGCYMGLSYPAEQVGQMASRYPGAIVAFNGDFFSPSYSFGAMGLTVKNGKRLDGNENDRQGREVRRSSLSISIDGDVRIGPIPLDMLPNPNEPWTWIPDPETFYNSIGGLPMLVKNGHVVDLHEQCMQEEGWCPDQYYPRARTAFGKTVDGKVFVVVVPEENGLTIEGLAFLMVELGAKEAINLDGGGSSQLWYDGTYLHTSYRAVAEGVIVFSTLTHKIGQNPAMEQ